MASPYPCTPGGPIVMVQVCPFQSSTVLAVGTGEVLLTGPPLGASPIFPTETQNVTVGHETWVRNEPHSDPATLAAPTGLGLGCTDHRDRAQCATSVSSNAPPAALPVFGLYPTAVLALVVAHETPLKKAACDAWGTAPN